MPEAGFGRRLLLTGALAAPVLVACAPSGPSGPSGPPGSAAPPAPPPVPAPEALAALEKRFGGRIGVYGIDTGNGATVGHRAGERFPMCSTFKPLAAAAVLRLRQSRPGLLEQVVRYDTAQVVENSPVTELHVADGMTVSALCEAAITRSDNTAGNLLLRTLGGPAAVTELARSLGDPMTRLDRYETELNDVPPGDVRDTTTPGRMAANLNALVLGQALDPAGRDLLTGWLVGNKTGDARIRAGLPAGWRTGDKTGAGARGEVNDVAVTWPPGRAPVIIAVYTAPADPNANPDNSVLADAARIVAGAFANPN